MATSEQEKLFEFVKQQLSAHPAFAQELARTLSQEPAMRQHLRNWYHHKSQVVDPARLFLLRMLDMGLIEQDTDGRLRATA